MEKKRRKEIRRDMLIQIKVTVSEFAEIEKRALFFGLSRSAYVRNCALKNDSREYPIKLSNDDSYCSSLVDFLKLYFGVENEK